MFSCMFGTLECSCFHTCMHECTACLHPRAAKGKACIDMQENNQPALVNDGEVDDGEAWQGPVQNNTACRQVQLALRAALLANSIMSVTVNINKLLLAAHQSCVISMQRPDLTATLCVPQAAMLCSSIVGKGRECLLTSLLLHISSTSLSLYLIFYLFVPLFFSSFISISFHCCLLFLFVCLFYIFSGIISWKGLPNSPR